MPTLKDTKTLQYFRELKWENRKIQLVFSLGVISDHLTWSFSIQVKVISSHNEKGLVHSFGFIQTPSHIKMLLAQRSVLMSACTLEVCSSIMDI